MYVILGATGNTGSAAATALLTAGHPVRVVSRSQERLGPLVARGAEAAVGDAFDGDFLARAFDGAAAVYALVPPDLTSDDFRAHYDRAGVAVERGLAASGVRRLVFLSSQGAQHADGTGPIKGLHDQEVRFRGLGLDLTVLRPGYFFENHHLASLGMIRQLGVNGGAIEPDVRFTQIATADIGAVAAREMSAGRVAGDRVLDLYGPRQLSMAEATSIVGAALGHDGLAYQRFPDGPFVDALVGSGFSRHVAELFLEMAHGISSGLVVGESPPTPATTGDTTLEAFAPTLAAAYRAL